MGLIKLLGCVTCGVRKYFSSDLFGLVLDDLVAGSRSDGVRRELLLTGETTDNGEESDSRAHPSDDEEATSEHLVLQAIHESEINLWKMKQENPKDFQFFDEDSASGLPSKTITASSPLRADQPKRRIPSRSNTDIPTPDTEHSDSSPVADPKSPLSWSVDTGGFERPKSMRKGIPLPNSRLPQKKTTRRAQDASGNWVLDSSVLDNVDRSLIPSNTAEVHMMGAERKVLDIQRWYCISRPQYKTSCGISSVVSCWNYLFSTLGRGRLKPISQEEALAILGFKPDFAETKFGPFTGNATLMRWFHNINEFYGVVGRTYYLYKPRGNCKTLGVTSTKALSRLKEGLHRADCTFIYHCSNHYFCPIGYEDTPLHPTEAYRAENLSEDSKQTWVLVGDTSSKQPSIHCIKWDDVVLDLETGNPDFYDARRLWKGQQNRKKTGGGNLHCIMAFEKSASGIRGSSIVPQPRNGEVMAEEDFCSDIEDLQDS